MPSDADDLSKDSSETRGLTWTPDYTFDNLLVSMQTPGGIFRYFVSQVSR
jgi:hypothetical protein